MYRFYTFASVVVCDTYPCFAMVTRDRGWGRHRQFRDSLEFSVALLPVSHLVGIEHGGTWCEHLLRRARKRSKNSGQVVLDDDVHRGSLSSIEDSSVPSRCC